MTPTEFAAKIDHTILKPEATLPEVQRILAETLQYRFASACIAPAFVRLAASTLHPAGLPCCTVVGFPHGTSKPTIKAIEATAAIKDGADEIDIVAHLPFLLNQDVDAARAELLEIVRAARAARRDVVIKVIVESALLLAQGPDLGEARIAAACRAIRESGCDFIKTSTGFHPAGGASLPAIQLMKKHADTLLIKAAGGIRDLPTAQALLSAGAHRLGLSSSLPLLSSLSQQNP